MDSKTNNIPDDDEIFKKFEACPYQHNRYCRYITHYLKGGIDILTHCSKCTAGYHVAKRTLDRNNKIMCKQ